MTITFDVLVQFQKNKVWQTAQTMNNMLMSNQNGSFITMETIALRIRGSEKCLFGFKHSNSGVKIEFF